MEQCRAFSQERIASQVRHDNCRGTHHIHPPKINLGQDVTRDILPFWLCSGGRSARGYLGNNLVTQGLDSNLKQVVISRLCFGRGFCGDPGDW